MTPFKLTEALLEEIALLISNKDNKALKALLLDIHFADVAEIVNELNSEEATYLIKLLDSEKTSDILTELDEDMRESILANLSAKNCRRIG